MVLFAVLSLFSLCFVTSLSMGIQGFFLRYFQIALLKEDKVLVVCITVSTKYWSACRDLAKERP